MGELTEDDLSFVHSGLCQTALPHQRLASNDEIWQRSSGRFHLMISPGVIRNKEGKAVRVGVLPCAAYHDFLTVGGGEEPNSGRPDHVPASQNWDLRRRACLTAGSCHWTRTANRHACFSPRPAWLRLRAMMRDRRLADPEKFAHIRVELGMTRRRKPKPPSRRTGWAVISERQESDGLPSRVWRAAGAWGIASGGSVARHRCPRRPGGGARQRRSLSKNHPTPSQSADPGGHGAAPCYRPTRAGGCSASPRQSSPPFQP
jgi:hypothetical protein